MRCSKCNISEVSILVDICKNMKTMMKIVKALLSQDRQACYQDLQQTNHPYIPNIPNPYPQPQAYPHHLGGNHGQHNLHGFQGDLNEKNQVGNRE